MISLRISKVGIRELSLPGRSNPLLNHITTRIPTTLTTPITIPIRTLISTITPFLFAIVGGSDVSEGARKEI